MSILIFIYIIYIYDQLADTCQDVLTKLAQSQTILPEGSIIFLIK